MKNFLSVFSVLASGAVAAISFTFNPVVFSKSECDQFEAEKKQCPTGSMFYKCHDYYQARMNICGIQAMGGTPSQGHLDKLSRPYGWTPPDGEKRTVDR